MVRSCLASGFRVLRKQRGYAAISAFSLVVGLTCFILLMLFARYELGYDSFHRNASRIHLVGQIVPEWNRMGTNRFGSTCGPLAATLEREFPEVERAVRTQASDAPVSRLLTSVVARGQFADRGFFEMFTYGLTAGDPRTALQEPFAAVLSESLAAKLFGRADPVGQTVASGGREYRVTGIMKDPPKDTHLPFEYLLSFATIGTFRADLETSWPILNYVTYVQLRPGVDAAAFAPKLRRIVDAYHDAWSDKRTYFLVPLRDLHTEAGVHFSSWKVVGRKSIRLLMAIAVLVLAVACVNYVNLATARASARGREVGVRKTFGADRRRLIGQFLGESFVLTGGSLLASLVLVRAALPLFGRLAGIDLPPALLASPATLLGLLALGLAVGFLAGWYPALVLSSLAPSAVLRGAPGSREGGRRLVLRNALVVFQFGAAMALVAGTLVIRKQMDYVRGSDAGYRRENVLALRLWEPESRAKHAEIEQELRRLPAVASAAVSNVAPVRFTEVNDFRVEGESGAMVELPQVTNYFVDFDYFDLFGLTFVAGRGFSRDLRGGLEEEVVLNESAARMAGLAHPLGKRVENGPSGPRRIVGVVKDIHFTSFREKIGPLMFTYRPGSARMMFVRLRERPTRAAIASVEAAVRRHVPDFTFDASFMDEIYGRLYETEDRLGGLLTGFSAVAILVASVGLFGLVSFVVDRKRKEIGIRKVLGASLPGILGLVARDLVLLVGVAGLVATPLAWSLSRRWLQGFYYRTSLDAGVFLAALASVALVAALCIARTTLRAARENPARSLKNLS